MDALEEQEQEKESKATHWHFSLKFHVLCHCLTNCSTYSKHGFQQLGSKWDLHTPHKILHPMLNFVCSFPVTPHLLSSLSCMVSICVLGFFVFKTHITINSDIKAKFSIHIILPMIMSHISTTKQNICECLMSVFFEGMENIEML